METDYMPVSNDANAYYTISGNKSALTKIDIRRLSMIFYWQEDLLSRINQHVMAVYQLAFDFTSITDLDPTLYAFHAAQLLSVLFYNRVQFAKMDLHNNAALIGYTPVTTSRHISQLIRDIYIYAFIINVQNDAANVLTELDKIYLKQALTGLQCH